MKLELIRLTDSLIILDGSGRFLDEVQWSYYLEDPPSTVQDAISEAFKCINTLRKTE